MITKEEGAVEGRGALPGPRLPAALLGALFLANPRVFYRRMAREYGEVVQVPTVFGPFVYVTSPEATRELLDHPSDCFAVYQPHRMYHVFGRHAMLLTDAEPHRRSRKLVAPAMHGARLEGFYDYIVERTLRAFESRAHGDFLALDATHELTLAVIVRAVLGITAPEEERLVTEWYSAFTDLALPQFVFAPALQNRWLGGARWSRATAARASLEKHVRTRLSAARGQPLGNDVLSMLAHTRDEHGDALSDDEIVDDALFVMFAGHESSSNVLAWALREVYSRPGVLARLRAELFEAAPRSARALDQLPYLEGVLLENMRFRPVTTEIVRQVTKPVTLRGHTIAEGHVVVVPTALLHENPAVFSEPDRFLPERFVSRKYQPWEFLPFGGGHRRCIGAAFAMLELKAALATIVQRFDLVLRDLGNTDTRRLILIEAPKNGIPVRARSRFAQ